MADYRSKFMRGLVLVCCVCTVSTALDVLVFGWGVAHRSPAAAFDLVLFVLTGIAWTFFAKTYQLRGEINKLAAERESLQRTAGWLTLPPPTPSKDYGATFGWRAWFWDVTEGVLLSPSQGTKWDGPELRVENWPDHPETSQAGIYALHVAKDWTKRPHNYGRDGRAFLQTGADGQPHVLVPVTGIVERFGRYVLGTDGWRAEWVIIRKLLAPTTEIGLALEAAFPNVEIIYDR